MRFLKSIQIFILVSLVCILGCTSDTSISILPVTDDFENTGKVITAKMDILFVIDNSVSMGQEQANMMSNFSAFIKNFVGKNYDYRIAVVGTDAWVTKGFFDQRTVSPLPRDGLNYVLTEDYISSAEHSPGSVDRVNNNGSAVTAYNPLDYLGFPDLNFKDTADPYSQICSRVNYVTSRFSMGDYTKALMGSVMGTHNSESGQTKLTADPRYLSGYRIVSSDDNTIDTDFYLDSGEVDTRDYMQLVNRELSFYDLSATDPDIPTVAPAGKTHILDIFRNNIMQGLDGCYGESGLESAKVALENTYNQNIIGGAFPRSDAHLAIIVVSDMRDEMAGIRSSGGVGTVSNYSLGTDSAKEFSQERLDYYDNFFSSISSENYGYTLHSIVPTGDETISLSSRYTALVPPEIVPGAPAGTDCSSDDVNTSYCYVATDNDNGGQKVTNDEIQPDISCFTEWRTIVNGVSVPKEAKMYTKLTEKTGGQKASICGDFADKLEKIAKIIIERTVEFKLQSVPADITKIQVNLTNPGQMLQIVPLNADNGWTYNSEGNSIVFHGTFIPEQGASVEIFYDPDSL